MPISRSTTATRCREAGAAGIATAVGVPVGTAAGYYGGWLDAALMRVVDLVTSFPTLMLALAAIVLFFPVWPHTMMLVLGGSDVEIVRRHVLPNIGGTVLVAATSVLGQALLLEATIEFFSYGLPASRWPSLGLSGYQQLGWWNWAFPAIVLTLVLSSVNVVGDALDEALNPLR